MSRFYVNAQGLYMGSMAGDLAEGDVNTYLEAGGVEVPSAPTDSTYIWDFEKEGYFASELTAQALRAAVAAEAAKLMAIAAIAIAPLQDAVDLDDATAEETALLKKWKQYRVTLNRIEQQAGYPEAVSWPVTPI